MGRLRTFIKNYENALIAWIIIAWIIAMGIYYSWDEHVLGAAILLVGIIGQAFAALGVWVGLVPVVGPLIVKALTIPLIWVLNGIGYIASVIAIKRGYTKEILNTRIMALMVLIGITIGYILGKLF